MVDLKQSMKVALANSYAVALKSQFFHWNVTGPNFAEYHAFFGGYYDEVFAGVDLIAELIRQLDEISPGSFSRFQELTTIQDAITVPNATAMMSQLAADNKTTLTSLYVAYKAAEDAGEIGVSNILQDRISAHHKHDWMLRSFTKQ